MRLVSVIIPYLFDIFAKDNTKGSYNLVFNNSQLSQLLYSRKEANFLPNDYFSLKFFLKDSF